MCDARRYSDEMHCATCALRWDVNDPEPPLCKKRVARASLTDRLRMLSKRLRLDGSISVGDINELDDMIEEVKLLDDARHRKVVPLKRRY